MTPSNKPTASETLLQTFAAWTGLSVSPDRPGYLDETTVEALLLQIERQRLTGFLHFTRRRRVARIGFQHGFLASYESELQVPDPDDPDDKLTRPEVLQPRNGSQWTILELLPQLLGWRSGSYRFQATEDVKSAAGFPLRPGQLLTLAWTLLIGKRSRFLKKKDLFQDFLNVKDPDAAEKFLWEIFMARLQGKGGELRIKSERGERRFQFTEGNLHNVLSNTEGNRIGDLCVRYRLLTKEQLQQIVEERKKTQENLTDLALQHEFLTEDDLGLVHLLQKWERCFEICHWPSLEVAWSESYSAYDAKQGVLYESSAGVSTPGQIEALELALRCRFCGIEVEEGGVCSQCQSKVHRLENIGEGTSEKTAEKLLGDVPLNLAASFGRRFITVWAPIFVFVLLGIGIAWMVRYPEPNVPISSDADAPVQGPSAKLAYYQGETFAFKTTKGIKNVNPTQVRRISINKPERLYIFHTNRGKWEVSFDDVADLPEWYRAQLEALRAIMRAK